MSDINNENCNELITSDIIFLSFSLISIVISLLGMVKCFCFLKKYEENIKIRKKYNQEWFDITHFKNIFDGIDSINDFEYKLYINNTNYKNNNVNIESGFKCLHTNNNLNNNKNKYVFTYFSCFESDNNYKTNQEIENIKNLKLKYGKNSKAYEIFRDKISKLYQKKKDGIKYFPGMGKNFNIYLSHQYILIIK